MSFPTDLGEIRRRQYLMKTQGLSAEPDHEAEATETAGEQQQQQQPESHSDAAFAAALQRQLDAEDRVSTEQSHVESDAALAALLQGHANAAQDLAADAALATSLITGAADARPRPGGQDLAADAALAASLQEAEHASAAGAGPGRGGQDLAADAALAASLQETERARQGAGGGAGSRSRFAATDRAALLATQSQEVKARTADIARLLRDYYTGAGKRSRSDRGAAVWLSKALQGDHYDQVTNPKSRGRRFGDPPRGDGYSCGWRCMQMVCSALMQADAGARQRLFGGCGFVPKIEDMKHWLEVAWQDGWDPAGRAQLSPVAGRAAWVGTTECWALLSSFGVSARIVTFKAARGGGGGGGGATRASSAGGVKRPPSAVARGSSSPVASAVEKWLWEYFGVAAPPTARAKARKLTPWDHASRNSSANRNSANRNSAGSGSGEGGVHETDRFPLYELA